MKSILFITYYFPPTHSIGVIRNYHLALQLKQYFNKILVITTSNQLSLVDNDKADKSVPFDVYHANTIDYRSILNRFYREKKTHYPAEKRGFFAKFLTKLNLSFPFNIIWGEGGIVYIWNAYRKSKKWIRNGSVWYVYSSFMPYSDHIVAYLLKLRFPYIYWIADFRDLHIDPVRKEVFLKNFQRWCNKKILSKADSVTTVSKGLAKHLVKFNDNVHVIRNGIPTSTTINTEFPSNQKFTITYTGSLYKQLQSPVSLIKVVEELIVAKKIDRSKIQIIYAGKDSSLWTTWMSEGKLEDILVDKGLISHEESVRLQRSSDCNVLLSWSSEQLTGILTGKFYEYLAANRPIINIINGVNDPEFEEIFDVLNAGKIFYPHSHEDLKAYLLDLYTQWDSEGIVKGTIHKDKLREYYWDRLAEKLMNKIQQ